MADIVDQQKDAIITNLSIQRKTATHTDVIIECNDGQLHAHKCILTSANEYFAAMFRSPMLDSKTNKIVLKQSSAAIEVILAFLYAESKPASLLDNPELLLEVIGTSHTFLITDLFKFYLKSLVDTINSKNLLEIWKLERKFEDKETLTRILDFVRYNLRSTPKEMLEQLTEPQLIESFGALLWDDDLREYLPAFENMSLYSKKIEKIEHLVVDNFSGVAKRVTYDAVTNRWSALPIQKLDKQHCTNWQPIFCLGGKLLYYGITSQKFVIFDPVANVLYVRPRSSNVVLSAFLDGSEIYFRELNGFVVFNFATRLWKTLLHEGTEFDETLLVSNGKIFLNSFSGSANSIGIYNMAAGTWQARLKPATELVNVRCKCLSTSCEGKLYFMKEKSLFVWSGRSNSWFEKVIPLVDDRVAVVANCELDLILFRERVGSSLWLYYVLCERWVKLRLSNLDVCQKSWFDISFSC